MMMNFPFHRYTFLRASTIRDWYKRHLSTTAKTVNLHAQFDVHNKIGIITLKSPGKVNVLNLDVLTEVEEMMVELRKNSNIVGGVLISDKPDCFIAGADINIFSSEEHMQRGKELSEHTQMFLESVEQTKKPIVAAIMGSCLGGGLEVALACHYRLAVHGMSTFGFPEVLLGLLPGAGGTQRLPSLINLPEALDMMLTGKTIKSNNALAFGFIDQIIDPLGPGLQDIPYMTLEHLKKIAVETSHNLATGDLKVNRKPNNIKDRITKMVMNRKLIKNYIFDQAKKKIMQQTMGLYPAPLKIIDVVKEGQYKGIRAGYKAEAKSFGELLCSNESKSLVSLYHGQTECKKNKYGTSSMDLNTSAVIGAGELGTDIASVCVKNGFETFLSDIKPTAIEKAESIIQNSIKTSVKKKRMSTIDGDLCLSRLYASQDIGKFSKANIVFEAVKEDFELKRRVLKEIEEIIPKHCVYASTTSSFLIKDLAKSSKTPEKVIGVHYSFPMEKMLLVEVIKTNETSKEALQAAVDVCLKQKRVPIVVNDGPGHYTCRVNIAMASEALRLIVEGEDTKRIDMISKKLGFPKGIITFIDQIGTDVACQTYNRLREAFGERFNSCSTDITNAIINSGYFGTKKGKGFFTYSPNSKKKSVNHDLINIIKNYKMQTKIPLSEESIKYRLVSRFVNESILCLEENIICSPLEGDVGAVFGLGFPPFTGGPFHYVDSLGAKNVVSEMKKLEDVYGPTFTPCQLLLSHSNDTNLKFFP